MLDAEFADPISGGTLPGKTTIPSAAVAESHANDATALCRNGVPESNLIRHKERHAGNCKSKNNKEDEMRDFVDGTAFNNEQGNRARKLFAAVVLAALDDAIADDKKYGNGPEQIARWARSRDGREVLSCAGIDPNERVVSGLMDFVGRGVRTSVALSREESERRNAAQQAEAA
jgi:Family of unknown function (DUF6280)